MFFYRRRCTPFGIVYSLFLYTTLRKLPCTILYRSTNVRVPCVYSEQVLGNFMPGFQLFLDEHSYTLLLRRTYLLMIFFFTDYCCTPTTCPYTANAYSGRTEPTTRDNQNKWRVIILQRRAQTYPYFSEEYSICQYWGVQA